MILFLMQRTTHSGVYAICPRDGTVVLVHKARGPYEGTLDLPGGRREAEETDDEALARELVEELGVRGRRVGGWNDLLIDTDTDSHGRGIQFRHIAKWAVVSLDGEPEVRAPLEDVRGVSWVRLDELGKHRLSPLATAALAAYLGARTIR